MAAETTAEKLSELLSVILSSDQAVLFTGYDQNCDIWVEAVVYQLDKNRQWAKVNASDYQASGETVDEAVDNLYRQLTKADDDSPLVLGGELVSVEKCPACGYCDCICDVIDEHEL